MMLRILVILSLILSAIAVVRTHNSFKEIDLSRTRENLLLREIKLLDYQISVLTEQVMNEKKD